MEIGPRCPHCGHELSDDELADARRQPLASFRVGESSIPIADVSDLGSPDGHDEAALSAGSLLRSVTSAIVVAAGVASFFGFATGRSESYREFAAHPAIGIALALGGALLAIGRLTGRAAFHTKIGIWTHSAKRGRRAVGPREIFLAFVVFYVLIFLVERLSEALP